METRVILSEQVNRGYPVATFGYELGFHWETAPAMTMNDGVRIIFCHPDDEQKVEEAIEDER